MIHHDWSDSGNVNDRTQYRYVPIINFMGESLWPQPCSNPHQTSNIEWVYLQLDAQNRLSPLVQTSLLWTRRSILPTVLQPWPPQRPLCVVGCRGSPYPFLIDRHKHEVTLTHTYVTAILRMWQHRSDAHCRPYGICVPMLAQTLECWRQYWRKEALVWKGERWKHHVANVSMRGLKYHNRCFILASYFILL